MCLLLLFGMAAAYMMYLVGRTIEITGHKSFAKIWEAVIGKKTAWVPSFIVFSVCFGCCLAYACMFGDLFAGCMLGFGIPSATRTVCLIVLGIFPVWPLSCMKDLSVLAPTSFGAIVAVCFTLGMMVLRFVDGSYAPGGDYHGGAPELGDHMLKFGPKSLALVNSLAVSYLCHYNGCKYYREYIGHRPDRFGKKIALSFSMVTCLFGVAMIFGFLTHTFGSDSVILNNYHTDDLLANIARLSMGLANALSFPLMFSGLREQAIELICFFAPSKSEMTHYRKFQDALSTVFVLLIVVLAVLITDASIVVGLVGSLCGAATIYVVPCLLFDRSCAAFPRLESQRERLVVRIIGIVGVVLMFAGAYATVAL
jgi:amino acid permease